MPIGFPTDAHGANDGSRGYGQRGGQGLPALPPGRHRYDAAGRVCPPYHRGSAAGRGQAHEAFERLTGPGA